jgi:hypothetical protein
MMVVLTCIIEAKEYLILFYLTPICAWIYDTVLEMVGLISSSDDDDEMWMWFSKAL